MTASTAIKLSPAMVTALKGAYVDGHLVYPADGTKTQTLKGLESRGLLIPGTDRLNADGYEAARQLGAEVHVLAPESAAKPPVVSDDAPLAQWEIDALNGSETKPVGDVSDESDTSATALKLIADLDKPIVVPNRKDKRHARFSVRGALSRLAERKRARKVAKYGQTNYKGEVLAG